MRIAIAGVILAMVVVGAVLLTMSGGNDSATNAIDDQHKAAAILVARCDAAMSSLDAALGSSQSPAAVIANRIDTCTRAKAAVERAVRSRASAQLDVAYKRVLEHLDQLQQIGGSAAGSAADDPGGRRTGLSPGGGSS